MAKGKKSVFFCQNCGHEENKWLGQCPMCKEWNTFVEEAVSVVKNSTVKMSKESIPHRFYIHINFCCCPIRISMIGNNTS